MPRIAKITRAYVRCYQDTGQATAYVEWIDGKGKACRTEGPTGRRYLSADKPCTIATNDGCVFYTSSHMVALFERAMREGLTPENEAW